MDTLFIVSTTCPTLEEAERLAQGLLEQGLAACVQLRSVRSHYVWQGVVQWADETHVEIKTTEAKLDAVEAFIKQHHSYEVPEILMHRMDKVSADYACWVRESVI